MKIIFKHKNLIYFLLIIIALLFAIGIIPSLKVNDKFSEKFSAERVADDIKYISKSPHSVQHPKERDVVRNYLYHRLEQMGGDVSVFNYDSIKFKKGGYFDIANVYAQFNPAVVTPQTQYILLVAHLDSRYFNIVKKDTVYSFGAADDGYGLGVILESVSCALKYQKEWKQGIKVLFTDSEENELDGMRSAYKHHRYLFDNVNFAINVEARGVKGDALLFEASADNNNIMQLYDKASVKRGFSLTSLIYRLMPNDTDFSIIKDDIPGLNFAVIDNLHYYHTNLDNFDNISLNSIQHYGAQIEPVVKEYLVSNQYSSGDSLKGDEDVIFFSLPLLGMICFSYIQYIIFNIVVIFIFCMSILSSMQYYNISFKRVLIGCGYTLVIALSALLIGEGVGYLAALSAGLEFNVISVKYVDYDSWIAASMFILLAVVTYIITRVKSKSNKYFYIELQLGTLVLLFALSLFLLVTVVENFFFVVPLFAASAAMLLGRSKLNYVAILLSGITIMLVLGYFINTLFIAITIGSLGILLLLATFPLIILISQYYSIKRNLI